jgi:hypothetical protein
MLRGVAIVGAGSLLAALTGCTFLFGNNAVQVGVKVNEEAVNGTLDQVAQRIQNEMRRLGLQVAASPQGDTILLTSTTKAGQRFVVVLKRTQGPQGERTIVHIDWEQSSDRDLWLQLLMVAGQAALAPY